MCLENAPAPEAADVRGGLPAFQYSSQAKGLIHTSPGQTPWDYRRSMRSQAESLPHIIAKPEISIVLNAAYETPFQGFVSFVAYEPRAFALGWYERRLWRRSPAAGQR